MQNTGQNAGAGAIKIARMMMERYGLHASAVAQERANEARLAATSEGPNDWNVVLRVISELRRTSYTAARAHRL